MQAVDALKAAASAASVPTTHIGPAMGKGPSYVANGAARGSSPRCDTMARMLSVCGYALVAVPLADVPASGVVIDAPAVGGEA